MRSKQLITLDAANEKLPIDIIVLTVWWLMTVFTGVLCISKKEHASYDTFYFIFILFKI